MASSSPGRTKTILYGLVIFVLAVLCIGFLTAYIVERNKNNGSSRNKREPIKPALNDKDLRLNFSVIPENYRLTIRSDPNQQYFNGTIQIDLEVVVHKVDAIILHCKNLNISKYSIESSATTIKNVKIDPERELCTFALEKSLFKGKHTLQIVYSGTFRPGQIIGFYRSSYKTLENQVRYLTATKFEPTYARMAFPCFDEPELKATFEIFIIHPSNTIALSNEIGIQIEPIDDVGFSKTTFAKTAKMSTYLVAFVISDFEYQETRTKFGTRIRVYSRPDQVHKTEYAVEAAARILSFYENYTGIPYLFSKMDLIGLPEFVSGAMENWGLVTYKETYILYDEKESSLDDMRRIASVIAHELIHMWFGNLVTLKWWNDLWIQEGFASFIEFYGQDYMNSSWSVWNRFLVDDLHRSLRTDSLTNTHPLSPAKDQVLTPDQITAMFNTISYSKGASILYMIKNIIGEERFQAVTRKFLLENQYSVVDTDKMMEYFCKDIKQVTGIDGKIFMEKWLYYNGFPIISVERNLIENSQYYKPRSKSLTLKQMTYSTNQSLNLLSDPWHVYISYLHPKRPKESFVFNQLSTKIDLDYILESNDWIKLNPSGRDYYLVNYQPNDWDLLIEELKRNPETFSIGDRANILHDAYLLAEISLFSYERLFNLFEYLKNEPNYIPWSVASNAITSLSSKLSESGLTLIQYQDFVRSLIIDSFDSKVDLAIPEHQLSYDQILLRNNLISIACQLGYKKCIEQCYRKFRDWLDHGTHVNPNIKSYVYKYGLQKSTKEEADWRRLWDLYESEKDALEKSKLMSALSATKNYNLLLLLVSYSEDQTKINNENFFFIQQSIASNSEIGRGLVWEYIKNHWEDLKARFGLNDRRLGSYVRLVTSGFRTESRLSEVLNFFEQHPDAGAGKTARSEAIETIQNNIKWVKDNQQNILKSLNERDQNSKPWLDWRLDERIRPRHYEINLTVDVENEEFFGSIRIDVDVQKPIHHMILHSKDLIIKSSAVYIHASHRIQVSLPSSNSLEDKKQPFAYRANQYWVIPMNEIIQPNNYVAELSFQGKLSIELSGLYLSKYKDSKTGRIVKLATTQFQAVYARKVFPCFDEPQFKSTFSLAIEHYSNYSAISNMPVAYVQKFSDDKMKRTVFKKSVPMPTYLVAIVVSDFVAKSSSLVSNFSIYTYNPDINFKKVDYALMIGPKILDFYARYFDINYPLPKMDMISIPDFSMGAMENWGLITYRDVYVLYDKTETSSISKVRLCQIISHELAHMWFGNLVTMKWWDDLWLNEGFATFMQYKATDRVEPSWNYPEYFVINEHASVYQSDSLPSTHPLLTKITNDNSIQAVFDSITYAKGACIIRMLEEMVGEKSFRIAIRNYIRKYSYSNTLTRNLWAELSDVAKKLNVEKFMNTWIHKDGFPVITITALKNGSLKLVQERFLKDFPYSNASYIWSIPITYRLINPIIPEINNNVEKFYFETKKIFIDHIKLGPDNLIKFNIDQKGLYVVNYPSEEWERWIEMLNNKSSLIWNKTSALDRNNLLMDAFYLARSGRLPYEQCLRLAQFLKYERSYVVWQIASELLSHLRVFLIEQDQGIAFDSWVREKLISDIYDEIGWTANSEDDLNRRQLRALILDLACQYGNQKCLQKASEKFEEFMKQQSGHDSDILPVFLYHALGTNATEKKFEHLQENYNLANTTNEKMRYLQALSAVRNETMLEKLITQSLDDNYLRTQDFFTFLSYIASNPIGRDLAWKFYRDNYQSISDSYGSDNSNLGRAVYLFAFYFTTEQKRQEVLEFFQMNPKAGASALYRQQTIDLIDANIRWSKSFYTHVIEFVTNICDKKRCPWNVYRLNPNIQPQKYNLTIQVDTETFQYNGTVKIHVNIYTETEYIILHAATILNVSSPKVIKMTKQKLEDLSIGTGFYYSPMEFYVIPLKSKIANGNYLIEAQFNGSLLKGGQVGLYRGWYDDPESSNRINLAASQFQSIHARKVFPCFDEPSFKQNISITVIHQRRMNTTLSNMKAISSKPHETMPGWMKTTFETTPPMVTYLIAILVSDFKCTFNEINELRNLPISICSSPIYNIQKHQYSMEVTPKILQHYERYTQINYDFPKLDQIALPQFSAGAMENWGLVKYREKKLLWSEDENQSDDQQETCKVIAHELAHMWFGNLVTMKFWGDLWLNEAFASYMEFSAVNSTHPEWKFWDTFVISDTYQAILGDYEQHSRPLVWNISIPKEMSYSTRIVYNKGSTILNMFEQTMGSDNFIKSIRKYLKKFSYKVVTTEDLFEAFKPNWIHKEVPLIEFMESWTKQMGFPYLNITYDKEKNIYSYVQQRFIRTGEPPQKEFTYVIPFSYYSINETSRKLEKSSIQFLRGKYGTLVNYSNSIIKVNPNFNGFYFVNYPAEQWSELIKNLVLNNWNIVSLFNVNDRSELIVSSYFLSRAKLAPYFTAFNLYNYLVHERHYAPWSLHSKLIANLAWEMERTEYRESYLLFEQRLTRPHYSGLQFWNDSQGTIMDRMFRKILIKHACGSGNKQCLKDAQQKFLQWKETGSKIPPNLFLVTLSYGIRSSLNVSDYEFVWNKFLLENDKSSKKTGYLEALSYIPISNSAKKYLDMALNETLVSVNHFVDFFIHLIHRYEHAKMIWDYFTKNYSMLARKLSSSQMDQIITTFADHTITEKRKIEMWNFLNGKKTGVSIKGQESTFARIEFNLQWMSENKQKVGEWFSNNACGRMHPESCPWAKTRIEQNTIIPIHYDLTIQVNFTTNIYNGSVRIKVGARKHFEYIVLHAAHMLQVDLISVKVNSSGKLIEDVSMFRYLPNYYVVLEFGKNQSLGHYELTFNFSGNLLDAGLSGLYISNYTDGKNKFKMASTQFEFFDARKVFPCFDEPAYKSTFAITIIHDSSMNTTLSNMEIMKKTSIQGTQWIETKFKESPKMVTYLVAMTVSNFVCKHHKNSMNVTFGICASHLQAHKLDYALGKAPVCLEHLVQKLAIPYPMTKIDLIAIPDFSYGAMENWGLITFQESTLLFHENDTTSERKMSIMKTIAHELAHFWFGNLVTCEWWDFITLNEAFATYMQYTTLAAAEPNWNIFDLFLMLDFEYALIADAKDNHPIIRNVTSTNEIEQYDASIIYSKGATILRMTESVMGTENFYCALRKYLKDYAYKTVRPENLLENFDKFFQIPDSNVKKMSDFLQDWFYSNGVPYINITKSDTDGEYYIVQDRFLLQEAKNQTKPIWKIPLRFYIDDKWNDTKTRFMIYKNMSFSDDSLSSSSLIKLNAGHQGFYLVNYSPEIWNKWIETLQTDQARQLPVSDRAGLLMDAFYLSHANLISYSIPLNLAKYLCNEKHITPWTIAIRGFTSIQNYVGQESSYTEKFRQYLQDLVEPVYKELAWNDQGINDVQRRLRSTILDFACFNQLKHCLDSSNYKFKNWINGQQTQDFSKIPPPNLLSVVLKYGLKYSDSPDEWLFVWSQYSNETSATRRAIYMNALVQTHDEKLLKMLMMQSLDTKVIRSQDSYSVLLAITSCDNSKSLKTLWQFFQDNYLKMIDTSSPLKLTQIFGLLSRISSRYFFTDKQKNEMQNFLTRYPNTGLTKAQRKNILNIIDSNINWMKQRMIEIQRFLLCGKDVCPFTEFRLNPKVIPENYSLLFKVDMDKEEFEGSVEIDVQLNETIEYVIVHAATSLNITKSEVFDLSSRKALKIKKEFPYEPFEFWVLELNQPIAIPKNNSRKIKLKFEFNSKLATDMLGFYLSKYYDSKKKIEVKLASTQFQNIYARRAFPCFDEPSFKSKFQVKIVHSYKYKAMSNNIILRSTTKILNDSYSVTEFKQTPKMVTYLLAFIISDFECESNDTLINSGGPKIQVRVCSTPPEINNINYSLSKAPDLLKSFQKKLGYPYQLEKIDLVAIPDFSAGAMENWGLLTFRETSLLWNEKTSSAANKMSVASVVAHEIAHMWFGNLVTCNWWTDLWLNEAFASYLEWFSVDQVEPDWNYKQLFYMTDYILGMDSDASITAHPLVRPSINSPSEIPYISHITYQKGSSILRMFELVLNSTQFYKLLEDYLKTNSYGTVDSIQLFNILSKAKVINLNNTLEFLKSWTLQPGFPYLNVTKTNATNEYIISQQRFLSSGKFLDNKNTWILPLSYYIDYNTSSDYIIQFISKDKQQIRLQHVNSMLPIKFNWDSQGFYIVNYPIEDWNRWTKIFKDENQMKQLKLTSQDYSQLLYDAFRLANVDLLPFDILFNLLSIMKTNRMLSVWSTGSTILNQMWPYFRNAYDDNLSSIDFSMQKAYQKFAHDLVRDVYKEFNLQVYDEQKSNINNQRLRSTVTSFACAYRYDICLVEAQFEYKKWRYGYLETLSPNVITVVLQYALQESQDLDDWNFLWEKYSKEQSTVLKLKYLQALVQTRNKDLLNLLLERANNQTMVRRQDYLSMYNYLLRTPIGFEVGWKYFQKNYQQILSKHLSSNNMGRLINYFAKYLFTREDQNKFQRFFQENNYGSVSDVDLNKAMETIENNINWASNHRMKIFQWLRKQ